MQDTCVILPRTVTTATDGQAVESWPEADGHDEICGFQPTAGTEQRRADLTILAYDARLRLPLTVSVTYLDKVRITKRFGVTLTTPLTFQVEGDAQQGPSGLVLLLKRVTT